MNIDRHPNLSGPTESQYDFLSVAFFILGWAIALIGFTLLVLGLSDIPSKSLKNAMPLSSIICIFVAILTMTVSKLINQKS